MIDPLARAAGQISIHPAGHGVIATLRREKGHDIAAACGQLRLQTNRAKRKVRLSV
jgi:adenine C2-methylase RlmN of 23S rRNA A2503 and tRNA A37